MASLSRLKSLMWVTLFLIFGTGFALISIVTYALGVGVFWTLVFVGIFLILQWFMSPYVVAWSTHLKYLADGENKWLQDTVKELALNAQVPAPKVAVVPDPDPNAFVFGRTVSDSTLAVHQGLLEKLNKEEIRSVLAHEIGHLRHRDCLTMTLASAVPLIAYILARGFLRGARYSRKKGVAAFILIGIISYLVYFISQLLVKYLSRSREYYADAYAAYSTKDPHSLQSALAKITYGLSMSKDDPSGLRAFYIGDPVSAKQEIASIMEHKTEYDLDRNGVLDAHELQLAMSEEVKKSSWTALNEMFSTHPNTFKRITLLGRIESELKTGSLEGEDAVYKFI